MEGENIRIVDSINSKPWPSALAYKPAAASQPRSLEMEAVTKLVGATEFY